MQLEAQYGALQNCPIFGKFNEMDKVSPHLVIASHAQILIFLIICLNSSRPFELVRFSKHTQLCSVHKMGFSPRTQAWQEGNLAEPFAAGQAILCMQWFSCDFL